ncbi:MAG: sodium:proton exchanger [Nitrospirae bacterium GWC2_57_13]|jgi:cation:H+ antiporter|nr:MAG: sodium:proton exchanger [Nitrospirae bacterium GWC2_57_13]HAS52628.1 sodium:proton exchanger [Nitrospiraceae bacterium]
MTLWTGFIACTVLIVYSGMNLSKYGDILAEKTGLSRTWIGVVLMAAVTSLPELITGISSVAVVGVPEIAAGDVFGSCVFNMLILAVLDAISRPMPLYTKAHTGHVLSAGFGILLIGVAAVGLFAQEAMPAIGWIGSTSFLIIALYLAAMRMVYSYEKRQIAAFIKERAEELKYETIATRSAVLWYVLNAVVVIVAATFLPGIGEGIAERTGLGQTFVGNIFIALSTSLPEVVVSVAALRIGAVDLAIGNLLGSNIFNIFILALDDLFFLDGPLLTSVSTSHGISALSAIMMTSLAVIGLVYRAEKKRMVLSWHSVGMIMVYMGNMLLLFGFRK